MISSWLAFTFVVLKKIFAIFWTKQPRNIILWVLLTHPNLHFHKNLRYFGKITPYKSENQISGFVLWILDKSFNHFDLGLRLFFWKKEAGDHWFPTLPLCTITWLFYKISIHRQYPTIKTSEGRALKAELLKILKWFQCTTNIENHWEEDLQVPSNIQWFPKWAAHQNHLRSL